MDRLGVPCPAWMVTRFEAEGGRMTFRRFMELALHDPVHGAYGSGNLRVGTKGDFVTSPAMGSDFAALLSVQLAEWLDQIHAEAPASPLSLVEVGPGEGDLAADVWAELHRLNPPWIGQLELVLVERNPGMESRQRERLASTAPGQVRWTTLDGLAADPIRGAVVAHELLDAFPVDRLIWRDGALRQMGVALSSDDAGHQVLHWDDQLLPDSIRQQLDWVQRRCGFTVPPAQVPEGWTTEWHSEVAPWLEQVAKVVESGVMLIVDYAHDAERYYSSRRLAGTLLAYQQQQASAELLADAGCRDLTAHLCIDTLLAQARDQGWMVLGQCRQGEALLALGLGERLHNLQRLPASELPQALQRREALLRLVDPAGLGEFRWIALSRSTHELKGAAVSSRCLQAPECFS